MYGNIVTITNIWELISFLMTLLKVLNFDHYKKRGPMFLDKVFTERLLEQLEDAEALLATMLTSRLFFFSNKIIR